MAETLEIVRILADIRGNLPGALDTSIRAELFDAMKEFCEGTNVWQEDINVSIIPNIRAYTLVGAGDGRIVRLMNLYNSTDLQKSPVAYATMHAPGVIDLRDTPNQAALWVATVAKTVRDPVDADGNPVILGRIVSKYSQAFTDGTLGRMYGQTMKPYSNPQMALFRLRRFRSAISVARVEILRMNDYGAQAWRYPQGFAMGRRQGFA